MAAVFSTKLFEAPAFSGGPVTQYICPMTFRTVVRTISIVFGNVTISGMDAWVQTQSLTKLCRAVYFTTLSNPTNNGGTMVFNGRWVLDPGDELQTQTVAGTVDFYASGYQLTLP